MPDINTLIIILINHLIINLTLQNLNDCYFTYQTNKYHDNNYDDFDNNDVNNI
jgi:hypothetical protein